MTRLYFLKIKELLSPKVRWGHLCGGEGIWKCFRETRDITFFDLAAQVFTFSTLIIMDILWTFLRYGVFYKIKGNKRRMKEDKGRKEQRKEERKV